MNDIRDQLEAADPLRGEPPLSNADVQRMRHATIAAAAARSSPWTALKSRSLGWFDWRWAFVTAAIAVIAGTGVNQWLVLQRDSRQPAEAPNVPMAPPRQLQFVTAGGTRVIWIFNPEFETTEGSNR